MGELLDQVHVFPQDDLNRGHREESGVEFAKLLARIAHDVVEVHTWQPSVPRLKVDFEVPVADRAENAAAIVKHHVPPPVAFAEQEQWRLIPTVGDTVAGYLVQRSGQASRRREHVLEIKYPFAGVLDVLVVDFVPDAVSTV